MPDYYETHASSYAEIEPEQIWREQLERFASSLKPGCRVLDMGCGAGHESHWLIQKGFDVESLDGSAAMAREAKERYGIKVNVLRMERLDAQSEYDAIWASASIHHVRREAIARIINAVANALKPDGWFYSGYKELEFSHR